MLPDSERVLAGVPLLQHAPREVVSRVAKACIYRDFEEGQEIVGHLEDNTDAYFVLAGRATVRIYSPHGKVVSFRQIGEGDVFGEFSALDDAPRSASVEADVQTRIAVLPADEFRKLIDEVPAISRALMAQLVQQLRAMTERVFELSTLPVNDRLLIELVRIARNEGRKADHQPNKVCIDSPPTHCELASRISTHREAITRHLNYLSRQGVISRRGRSLVIENMSQLASMVREATTR